MKTYKFALRTLSLLSVLTLSFVACEQDFTSIDSDIINPDTATSFETDNTPYSVITYTDALGPVQTDNLAINFLGVYDDPNYGRTTASFVTQVSSSLIDPDFGTNVVLDSVVVSLPFFSRAVGVTDENVIDYALDSIFPRSSDGNYSPIKLGIYENNYFLRDFDPNSEFGDSQNYFSNKSLSTSESISDADLESVLIDQIDTLSISRSAIILTDNETPVANVTQTQTPGIRLSYTADDGAPFTYWVDKIFGAEGSSNLSNSNNFNNYFRGIYFKAEPFNNNGSLIGFNLASENANITLYYTRDSNTTAGQRDQSTYVLRFSGNRINFFDNDFSNPLVDGDAIEGDTRLRLKGGEGSVANIKLFGGDDAAFQDFKDTYANFSIEGEFESYRRLINEANLVFYVDESITRGEEPSRVYLYDKDNNLPLPDYFADATNTSIPLISKANHLGILDRVDNDFSSNGIKYRIKITEHLKRLIENDSTNVALGLAVSGNVNLEEILRQRDVLGEPETNVPVSSLISPRGTILHGSNSEDVSKRVQLEIFYTCLKSDGDCQ